MLVESLAAHHKDQLKLEPADHLLHEGKTATQSS